MYLKSLKLAGFKSFVDATTIPVRSHMNAVVGPNGCGKSNIVDAIRWVIGETSAKQLRGQSMTDVIFNGTSTRKPVGKAMVELLFDNSDGRAGGEYAKFNELAIRRELERDGQSNYFINGTLCRRRDIIDIFLGTGLGPRSYSIIEQGMISQLIEAKPEEFRVYLEEAAGISKYKERRRETESRMRRTQENLDRLNDLCDELTKQLRHLKRQSNAAENYKEFKAEERLLQAQIKGLQWQSLADQLINFDERIHKTTVQQEEQLANQSHLETDMEKARLGQTESQDQQNEIQKHYYGLGAEIARVEQQIKDRQEQTQRWRNELEEAEALWQELMESSAEHQDQIQEIAEEITALTPQKETIQSTAKAAQIALQKAEKDMQAWQELWERYQKTYADITQRVEVVRTNKSHYENQLQHLSQREARLLNETVADLAMLERELEPIAAEEQKLKAQLETIQAVLKQLSEDIVAQRQRNADQQRSLNHLRHELQNDEGRYASLQSLQDSALAGDQQANAWLAQHNLAHADRLGKKLQVKSGWERAVETVLGGYFDAVFVDDASRFALQMDSISDACLTLIDRHQTTRPTTTKAATLADQVTSDWPLTAWLNLVYVADSTQEALSMRADLSPQESVITRDGLWVGVNWIRKAKAADSKAGVLAREQELKKLSERIAEKQETLEAAQLQFDQDEKRLAELEQERDIQHRQYQSLSQAHTKLSTEFSAKRSRCDGLKQQQQRLQDEILHCQQQKSELATALVETNEQLENFLAQAAEQVKNKEPMLVDRDRYREMLREAREHAQREQQKSDEWAIRLSSNESQLALLKQTVSRAERQMEQLNERREHLKAQLADTNNPLDHLHSELQELLNRRIKIEEELRAVEALLESYHQQVRQLEAKRNQIRNELDAIKDRLQSIRIERQELVVRQTTIQEQLAESDFALGSILEAMPEEANTAEWERRADSLAQKINRLGPINLAAIEEYEQVSERKIYLDKQQADLQEALDILQNAIRKIDRETRQKFKETYDKVNAGFTTLFPQIFGGGSASLVLEEEDDLLTSGVIVRAQPPGKRNSTIYMLSGGEKALTAISLVFALFQLNPAPFCVLDEVDAPLDDINVGRFCQLVKEMSKVTQFIVISHNKVTIEMADHLMGVTMQEPGVSRLVSVDMEEAIAMAEA